MPEKVFKQQLTKDRHSLGNHQTHEKLCFIYSQTATLMKSTFSNERRHNYKHQNATQKSLQTSTNDLCSINIRHQKKGCNDYANMFEKGCPKGSQSLQQIAKNGCAENDPRNLRTSHWIPMISNGLQ